jgi:hypothetical protein
MATDLTSRKITAFVGGYKRLAYGSVSIGTAGSATDMDTGLNTIDVAWVQVAGTTGGTENTLSLTCEFGTDDGLVDIYCFDEAGTAATTDTVTIYVMAIGQ